MQKISDVIEEKYIFTEILESIHDGIILIDTSKKVVFANSSIGNIFNINNNIISDCYEDSIIGNFLNCEHNCLDCEGCSLDTNIKKFINCIETQKLIGDEFQFTNKNGEIKYLKYSIVPIKNMTQTQLFITFDDITEEKRLYKELELKHFRLKSLTESLENSDSIVIAVANSVEAKDKLTKGHISRVAYYAEKIGQHFNMTEKELEILKKGAILHDIGKIGTPDGILNKPGPLSDEEFEIMKKHPADGWNILKSMKSFAHIAKMVRHHHEKLDGSGYPDGLKAVDIDIYTRIVAIVDIYDALTAKRPYREALSREQALEIIFSDVEKGKLDREVAKAMEKVSINSAFTF